MRDSFVITSNVQRFLVMVKSLIEKPSRIDRMGLIYGKWGLGKSTTIEWYASNNPCYWVRAMAAWKKSLAMALEDCLRAYRVEAVGRVRHDLRELIRTIKKHGVPFLIDEADRVVGKSILIETFRDVADLSRVPVILIGQENIYNMLQREGLGNVFSRMSEIIEFGPLATKDVQVLSRELCELKCNIEPATLIRTVTLGDFRLVNVLLTKIEEICSYNDKTEITVQIVREAAKGLPNLAELAFQVQPEVTPKPDLKAATA